SSERFSGPPDLVVEVISPGSLYIDRSQKFREYEKAGVSEYWLVDSRPGHRRADFYRLDESGRYDLIATEEDERVSSEVLEGLWLRPAWLWQEPLPDPLLTLADIVGREALIAALRREAPESDGECPGRILSLYVLTRAIPRTPFLKNSVYIFSSGTLERHQNTLRYSSDKGKRFIPIETTSDIHIFGECDLNTRMLNFLTQQNIPLHLYNYYGYYAGSYMPREQYVSGYLTLQQASHYNDFASRLALAHAFVLGALRNIERVLMYYQRRGADVSATLEAITTAQALIPQQRDIDTLMAVEGNARMSYYGAWDSILNNADFRFEGRSP
ncbi:MAG: CRISPR-associated endonuclease Cas1, partial [Deinococcota bacterium]|nr:CRISPR-associated endonuclease Cas1 [Deinococcota bacterium]